jgi:tetratricopeptide (TPR) repeat protein
MMLVNRALSFAICLCLFTGSSSFASSEHLRERALNLYSVMDYRGALVLFLKLTEQSPHDGPSWDYAGWCYRYEGDWKSALECFEQALPHLPGEEGAWAVVGMGETYLGGRDYEKAFHSFSEAISRAPEEEELVLRSLKGMAWTSVFSGDIQGYQEILETVSGLDNELAQSISEDLSVVIDQAEMEKDVPPDSEITEEKPQEEDLDLPLEELPLLEEPKEEPEPEPEPEPELEPELKREEASPGSSISEEEKPREETKEEPKEEVKEEPKEKPKEKPKEVSRKAPPEKEPRKQDASKEVPPVEIPEPSAFPDIVACQFSLGEPAVQELTALYRRGGKAEKSEGADAYGLIYHRVTPPKSWSGSSWIPGEVPVSVVMDEFEDKVFRVTVAAVYGAQEDPLSSGIALFSKALEGLKPFYGDPSRTATEGVSCEALWNASHGRIVRLGADVMLDGRIKISVVVTHRVLYGRFLVHSQKGR